MAGGKTIVSRVLHRDQFGTYITEIDSDGAKHNISVEKLVTNNGRVIEDEWVDANGVSYSTGGKT